jgi:Fe-S-cluster containining protein
MMPPPVSKLEKDQTFCFTCSPQVPCFNACCRDLIQVLTPYDVMCLKQFLHLSSTQFLKTYTQASTGPETGLPVVSLRFGDAHDLTCPFVTGAGCRVYPARPASCRTYPLARGVVRNHATGELSEQWALIREPHCLGFANGARQRVDQWVENQQIATHNRMNDMLLELISLKKRCHPDPLTPAEYKRFYTALYDLDRFRKERFKPGASLTHIADGETLERAATDDLALLHLAMAWVRFSLINNAKANKQP